MQFGRWPLALKGAIILFLFTLAALGGCDERSRPNTISSSAPQILTELSPAPDFELLDLADQPISLARFRGKVVLLNFWATWCVPCVMEMPALERLHQILKPKGFTVLAINMDNKGSRKVVEKFARNYGLSFPVALDPNYIVAKSYGVTGFPETILIGREGEIRSFEDPLKQSETTRIISDRPWDSEPYIRAISALLDRGLNQSNDSGNS